MNIFGRPEPDFTLKFNKISKDKADKSETATGLFLQGDEDYEGVIIDECYISESGEVHAGKEVAWEGPWISYNGSIEFEATEISSISSVFISNQDLNVPAQELKAEFQDNQILEGKLKLRLDAGPRLSMFGTRKMIEDFSFRIMTGSLVNMEGSEIEAGIHYGGYNAHHGTTEDSEYLQINIGVNQKRFDELSKLIIQKDLDSFFIQISGVDGFYRELANDVGGRINPSKVKVLTTSLDHHDIPKKYKNEIQTIEKVQNITIDAVTSQSFGEKD